MLDVPHIIEYLKISSHVDRSSSMRSKSVFFMLVVGLVAAVAAHASDVHPNMDAQAIIKQQQQIRTEATERVGRYKDLAEDKRVQLFNEQSRVFSLLENRVSIGELAENDQIVVFNALEHIAAIVNKAEEDRLICERVKPVGSNRPQTICMTVAERREAREKSQRGISNRDQQCERGSMGPMGCGSSVN